jgi:hypothetical protein
MGTHFTQRLLRGPLLLTTLPPSLRARFTPLPDAQNQNAPCLPHAPPPLRNAGSTVPRHRSRCYAAWRLDPGFFP